MPAVIEPEPDDAEVVLVVPADRRTLAIALGTLPPALLAAFIFQFSALSLLLLGASIAFLAAVLIARRSRNR
jgi:hypothetical protein